MRTAVLAAAMLAASTGALAQGNRIARPQDEEAVKALPARLCEAWNKGDGKELAALYAEDGDHVPADGRPVRGRASLEAWFTQEFSSGVYRGTTVVVNTRSVRFLKPRVAVVDASWGLSGGPLLSTKKGLMTVVAVSGETDEVWRIAAMRTYVPVESSAAPAPIGKKPVKDGKTK